MRALIKALWWAITLPVRIVWKLRKIIIVVGGAFAAYTGWQKRKVAADGDMNETSAS